MRKCPFLGYLGYILLILALGLTAVSAEEGNGQHKINTSEIKSLNSINNSTKEVHIQEEPSPMYEIKLVSPELLKTIQFNSGALDQILKVGPGITIGVSTPEVLYIRGDLQSDEFLLNNRNSKDIKNKIVDHLVAITFGRDNANISLLQADRDYMIWFDEEYTTDDINTTLSFARLFNNISTTTQFEDESVLKGDLKNNYEEIPYHYYQIRITSRQFLDDYKDDKYKSSSEDLLKDKNGRIVGIIAPGYVYLWDRLEGQERKYFIYKALFWNLGLHGEISTDPDSFFYTKTNYTTTLSDLDTRAIELLYGGRLSTGMNADTIKKALDISL